MPQTRRSRKDKKISLVASDVKSFDTCIDIDLPQDLCCEICQVTIDQNNNMAKLPSVKKNDFAIMLKIVSTDANNHGHLVMAMIKKTMGTIRKFNRVRKYLNIDTTVWIDGNENESILVDHYCY